MVILFNAGGTFSKALFTLYLLRATKGPLGIPEAALSGELLRIKDPAIGAEYIIYGKPLALEPLIMKVSRIDFYKPPEVYPPLRRKERTIGFTFVVKHEEIDRMRPSGERLLVYFNATDPVYTLKSKPKAAIAYYFRRFLERRSKKPDFIFRSDDFRFTVKCLSARFASPPKPLTRIPLKRKYDADMFFAFDPLSDTFAILYNSGSSAVVVDSVRLDVEIQSIWLYVEGLYRARKHLVDEILALARPRRVRKEF